jgi:hypothetical protein
MQQIGRCRQFVYSRALTASRSFDTAQQTKGANFVRLGQMTIPDYIAIGILTIVIISLTLRASHKTSLK